nr:MAG TPA_asm: hypothetical protein [Caudoviricetes sp.]
MLVAFGLPFIKYLFNIYVMNDKHLFKFLQVKNKHLLNNFI